MNETQGRLADFMKDLLWFINKYLLEENETATIVDKISFCELTVTRKIVSSQILISSYNDELTVSFDVFHSHFHLESDGRYLTEDTKEVSRLVMNIISGQATSYVKYKDGKWVGSQLISGEQGKYQDLILNDLLNFDYVTLKSWCSEVKTIKASDL